LKGERDQTNLTEIQAKHHFEHWVYGGNQRLNRVVKQMRKTEPEQNEPRHILFLVKPGMTT
jgi:hypothetical protein